MYVHAHVTFLKIITEQSVISNHMFYFFSNVCKYLINTSRECEYNYCI